MGVKDKEKASRRERSYKAQKGGWFYQQGPGEGRAEQPKIQRSVESSSYCPTAPTTSLWRPIPPTPSPHHGQFPGSVMSFYQTELAIFSCCCTTIFALLSSFPKPNRWDHRSPLQLTKMHGKLKVRRPQVLTHADAEAPTLWPPDAKSQLTGKDPDAGED